MGLLFGLLFVLAARPSAVSQTTQLGSAPNIKRVRLPFVGCPSDGQMGPLKAPMGQSALASISAEVASRLAYYKADDGPGVLAPRGWHCFLAYGSSGETLYVSQDPIDTKGVFLSDWKGLNGDVVQASISYGGTSGRFQVAKIVARVFPEYKAFVGDVIAEGIETAADFPVGPYPNDKLRYISNRVVEFETPAESEGLGTDSRLQKSRYPIRGVAILFGEEPDLAQLSVRLSKTDLIPPIIKSFETEVESNVHLKSQK